MLPRSISPNCCNLFALTQAACSHHKILAGRVLRNLDISVPNLLGRLVRTGAVIRKFIIPPHKTMLQSDSNVSCKCLGMYRISSGRGIYSNISIPDLLSCLVWTGAIICKHVISPEKTMLAGISFIINLLFILFIYLFNSRLLVIRSLMP